MTTQRDDTKDLMFRRGEIDRFFSAVTDDVTLPAILPWPSKASLTNDSRYVPYDQYEALEKERDELLERVMEHDAEQLARVCPGCYAVAPERCLPGCIDAEMEREREDERMNGDPREEDDDEGDMPW